MAKIERPFMTLGKHLKTVREQAKRSVAEVSGAVEIDETQLRLIEAGLQRPEEDVMLLLISYFNMADQEAMHLWELAKYDSDLADHLELATADDAGPTNMPKATTIMLVSMDIRTMYSDGVEVTWNDAGVTLNFTQSAPKGQGITVARVGMSHEQLKKVHECLETAMLHAKYGSSTKLLPPGTLTRPDKENKSL
ncbi:MAG TPA: helix-turn-helix transcriptional regulator [Candidatus Saccharimonadales bacterium]|nr:helix-turn-helix transcriptional regulator [Candidatus Saccharimonadales bacterium]